MKCTWSGGGILEIDLHHCDHPVSYHVLLNAPSKGIHKNLTLKEGDDKVLAQGDLGTVKLNVKKLTRQGNVITTTVNFIRQVSFFRLIFALSLSVDVKLVETS